MSTSPRNVASNALIATCWIVALLQCGVTDGKPSGFPDWRQSHSHGFDVAQDPNSVDERFGWSWGASSGNQHNHPQYHNNKRNDGDWSFGDDISFNNGNNFNNFNNGGGRDRFPGGNFNNFNPGSVSQQQQQTPTTTTQAPVTTAAPATTAAAPGQTPSGPSATQVVYSDEFYNCMANCRTTNEWNPVCGSDNNDYNNIQKLNCANSCGGNVQQLRRGPCRPFGK